MSPAIHVEHLPGYLVGVCQVENSVDDLFYGGDLAHGLQGPKMFLGAILVQRCVYDAGGYGIDLRSVLPIPPKQFVQTEREVCTHSEEQRSGGGRKNREIQGCLHSQSHRHGQRKLARRTALSKAAMRVFQPRTRSRPRRSSAAVAITAHAGI